MRYELAQAFRSAVLTALVWVGWIFTADGGPGGFLLWPLGLLWVKTVNPPTDEQLEAYRLELVRRGLLSPPSA